MPEKSLAELMAEEAELMAKEAELMAEEAEHEKTEKTEKERKRKEREAKRQANEATNPQAKAPRAPVKKPAIDASTLSRTERSYFDRAKVVDELHINEIPIEVLRGLLYFFEGRVNWKKDKGEMRRELARYLKYEHNLDSLIAQIRKIGSTSPCSSVVGHHFSFF
jgi:hypothetical protein